MQHALLLTGLYSSVAVPEHSLCVCHLHCVHIQAVHVIIIVRIEVVHVNCSGVSDQTIVLFLLTGGCHLYVHEIDK